MKKILLVEDSKTQGHLIARALEEMDDLEVVWVLHKEGVLSEYRLEQPFFCIIMDACLGGEVPNTLDLVAEIRKGGFEGPMIACSSENDCNDKLIKAGCNHRVSFRKIECVDMVRGLLESSGPH